MRSMTPAAAATRSPGRGWTASASGGTASSEPGVVARRVPAASEVDCRFRLEVASASTDNGAVPRPLDECVDEATWTRATAGGPVTLQLVRSVFGAELVGVAPGS